MKERARRYSGLSCRAVALASLLFAGALTVTPVRAQLGPIQHTGYLEYLYRLNRSEALPSSQTNLATWRAFASTYVWRPYILQLDGSLGLTRTDNSTSGQGSKGTLITGGLAGSLFARSRFPFRAYYENRDNRVDGDVFDQDRVSQNWGFIQTYSAQRGGRIALDYRASDNEDVLVDSTTTTRKFSSRIWQLQGTKYVGRNNFNLMTSIRNLNRDDSMQSEKRKLFNLRHQFRASPRFYIEDTTFFSDERITFDSMNSHRRFMQFNGVSNWRPQTQRPLLVIGRVIAQGVDSGPSGFENGSTSFVMTGSANYQYSPRVTISGNAGVTTLDPDGQSDESSVFQRLRTTYRADPIDVGAMQYFWGSSLEAGNRRQRNHGNDTVQNVAGVFDHSLSKTAFLSGGSQFQFSLSQQAAARVDTDDRRDQSLVHSAFVTWSKQKGRSSSYLRLSATDRRTYGDREDVLQLVTLQASSQMRFTRNRSLNGGITLQYSNNVSEMVMDSEMGLTDEMDNAAFTYGIDLTYRERDLFNVERLNFLSELRLLSRELRSDNFFDQEIGLDAERSDQVWRNELDYTVGKLELRLLTDVREINNRWTSQVFFRVRRYYGAP
jgi:hypothetical protein